MLFPRRQLSDTTLVHVPAAFLRDVRNDPVGHIEFHNVARQFVAFPFLIDGGKSLTG
jgi:hypothetical protein